MGVSFKLNPGREISRRAKSAVAQLVQDVSANTFVQDGERTSDTTICSTYGDVLFEVAVYKDGRVYVFKDVG